MIQYYALMSSGSTFVENYAPQCVGNNGEILHNGNVWFCDHIDDAKLFKTKSGAERAARFLPTYVLQVVEVKVTRKVVYGW